MIFCTLVCLEGAKQFLDSNKNMEFRQDVFFACQKIGIYFFACFFELKQAGQKKPCILPCKKRMQGKDSGVIYSAARGSIFTAFCRSRLFAGFLYAVKRKMARNTKATITPPT